MKLFYIFVVIFSISAQEQTIIVDFNLDGTEDIVTGIHSDSTFTVFFISNNDTISETFKLDDSASQMGFCGKHVRLMKEALDYDLSEIFGDDFTGYKRSKTDYGVKLYDEMCDSFHFFWNHDAKSMQWWRL